MSWQKIRYQRAFASLSLTGQELIDEMEFTPEEYKEFLSLCEKTRTSAERMLVKMYHKEV